MRMTVMLAVAGTLVLAGCNGGRHDENVSDENVIDNFEEAPIDVAPVNRAEPLLNTAAPENKVEAPRISEEQQIQDDAEASGMTSRLPDEYPAASPASDRAAESAGASRGAGLGASAQK